MSALFAHPVAVVPLTRLGFNQTALIIGSMTPDFIYFVQLSTNMQYGHTLPGVFLFCLPVGLFIMGFFQIILKAPLFSLLPNAHQQRLAPLLQNIVGDGGTSVRDFWQLSIALLVGACTHLLWDSCTHSYGWTVQHAVFLRAPLLVTSQGVLHVYKVLQHGVQLAEAYFWQVGIGTGTVRLHRRRYQYHLASRQGLNGEHY
jgi:hypothetical protein